MKRLLIANRGEIAVRIIRACRELGISPIAIYSEVDRSALHVTLADEAHCVGPAPASDSYLCGDHILEVARQAGADAVHPGYGFLSESAGFADRCSVAGFAWVGPPGAVIRALGDKGNAKRIAAAAGVPVVPGYDGDDQADKRLRAEARSIGFPVLIKARGGGGGRGMRLARTARELSPMLDEARQEAKAAFNDDRLLLERYIERPRHVEVQVFGDAGGGIIHLFERECSIQRRYQKIIEESPSPAVSPVLREEITAAAVRLAAAAGYVNAGTVEFLLEDGPGATLDFYFLEVNTRLQVEHPVTEAVTGRDLVKLQLRIASGEPLPFDQAALRMNGHAVEMRIYAEDPEGALPSTGEIAAWIQPGAPGIRVDSGVERGSEVTPYYDPMIAKLIVTGADRAEAVARAEQALLQFHVLGIRTNLPYLLDIVRHPGFRAGATTTAFLAEQFGAPRPPSEPPDEALLALAAIEAGALATSPSHSPAEADPHSPWRDRGGWRNVRPAGGG